MTQVEQLNTETIENFKKTKEFKEAKIFCILSVDERQGTRVFQSMGLSPSQLAETLLGIARKILNRLNPKVN